jgi:hypothetical protein
LYKNPLWGGFACIHAHASGIAHTNSPYNRYSRIRYPVLEGSGTCLGSRVLLKIPNTSEQTHEQTVFAHVQNASMPSCMWNDSDPSFTNFLQPS